MPATNRVLHDKRYYADGVFCEAPRKLEEEAAEADNQLSQSRWNAKDYHWEESDVLPFALQTLRDELENVCIWGKDDDSLKIVAVKLEGTCVSNVRKGKRILTYELTAKCSARGRRAGAGLDAVLSTKREFCHDEPLKEDDVGISEIRLLPIPENFDTQRAMRTQELFENLLRKKGLKIFFKALSKVCETLQKEKGSSGLD